VAGALMTAAVGLASSVTMGNAAVDRAVLDEYSNFTIADQSNPADADGLLDQITYYAKLDPAHRAQNGVPFAVVLAVPGKPCPGDDCTFEVVWISENQPNPATSGPYAFTPATPVPVKTGHQLALYFPGHGLVPYDYVTEPEAQWEYWEPSNHGKPTVGEELTIEWPNPDQLPAGFEDVNKRNYSVQGSTIDCTFSIGQPINADSSSVLRPAAASSRSS
jgi:hypothetical protein